MEKQRPRYPRVAVPATGYNRYAAESFIESMRGEQMLPQDPEEMLYRFEEGLAAIALVYCNNVWQLGAHAAVTKMYEPVVDPQDDTVYETYEIGALVTKEQFRNLGLATLAAIQLIEMMKERSPEKAPLAFANPKSFSIFDGLGMVPMPNELIPPEALEACATCPMFHTEKKNGAKCCDIPMWRPRP